MSKKILSQNLQFLARGLEGSLAIPARCFCTLDHNLSVLIYFLVATRGIFLYPYIHREREKRLTQFFIPFLRCVFLNQHIPRFFTERVFVCSVRTGKKWGKNKSFSNPRNPVGGGGLKKNSQSTNFDEVRKPVLIQVRKPDEI